MQDWQKALRRISKLDNNIVQEPDNPTKREITEEDRLRTQVEILTTALNSAYTALTMAPAWHEQQRAAIVFLKQAREELSANV